MRARHDKAVTIGEVLAESRIVPAGSFDSSPPANYFDRSTRLAMHELGEPSIAPLEEQAGKPNETPPNGEALRQQTTMSTIYREIPKGPGTAEARPVVQP